jgi:hypothetical protein
MEKRIWKILKCTKHNSRAIKNTWNKHTTPVVERRTEPVEAWPAHGSINSPRRLDYVPLCGTHLDKLGASLDERAVFVLSCIEASRRTVIAVKNYE